MTGTWWLDVFVAAGIVAGGLGLLGMFGRVVRWMLHTWKRVTNFLDDWQGEPDRPGVPGRPGVMERLAVIEAELHPNHGASLRDVVDRLERGVRRIEDQLAAHLEQHRQKGI